MTGKVHFIYWGWLDERVFVQGVLSFWDFNVNFHHLGYNDRSSPKLLSSSSQSYSTCGSSMKSCVFMGVGSSLWLGGGGEKIRQVALSSDMKKAIFNINMGLWSLQSRHLGSEGPFYQNKARLKYLGGGAKTYFGLPPQQNHWGEGTS